MKKLFLLIMAVLLASPVWAASEWLKTRPATTDTRVSFPTDNQANNEAIDRLVSQYPAGMQISYSSAAAVSVSAGGVVCSNSAGTVRKFRNNTSATSVGWSDIDAGSEASSTTYYLFANCDADAATATFKISTSATAPTGLTYYKKIGSFYNDSSSNITRIVNDNQRQVRVKESKTVGTTYQATTDGFVTAYSSGPSDPARVYLTGYTDGAATPTTVVAMDGLYYWSSGTVAQDAAGITFPVIAGDYYKVTETETEGSATSVMYFYPLY